MNMNDLAILKQTKERSYGRVRETGTVQPPVAFRIRCTKAGFTSIYFVVGTANIRAYYKSAAGSGYDTAFKSSGVSTISGFKFTNTDVDTFGSLVAAINGKPGYEAYLVDVLSTDFIARGKSATSCRSAFTIRTGSATGTYGVPVTEGLGTGNGIPITLNTSVSNPMYAAITSRDILTRENDDYYINEISGATSYRGVSVSSATLYVYRDTGTVGEGTTELLAIVKGTASATVYNLINNANAAGDYKISCEPGDRIVAKVLKGDSTMSKETRRISILGCNRPISSAS